MERQSKAYDHDTSVTGTLKSLIVAFVLAMMFRGFVLEGFVIPTGSMAPTLLGRHLLLHSGQTGDAYPAGVDAHMTPRSMHDDIQYDQMLGPEYPTSSISRLSDRVRMGDRILVLKSLYPFSEPDRFDVVVFTNPTNPQGDSANYIKRLIGLPNETIWLADGDVFVQSEATGDRFHVQRKPEHIQRAVWQPVSHSDFTPLHPERLNYQRPWVGDGVTFADRAYRVESSEETQLRWDSHYRKVTDWSAYNVFMPQHVSKDPVYVSDVRIAAGVAPDNDGLSMVFDLKARRHDFQFIIDGETASIRMREGESGDEWTEASAEIDPLRGGSAHNVEFWHVDQKLTLFLDDEAVVELPYDWEPQQRLRFAAANPAAFNESGRNNALEPQFAWTFAGSPVTLHRLRVDRDLFYRADTLGGDARENPTPDGFAAVVRPGWPATGTHPSSLAKLGPDHFFMLGDNSPYSKDSRLWGNAHPLVAEKVDPTPFVVHRSLLRGKAWLVYFPAPYSLTQGGRAFVPDFGSLRFIR